MTLYLWMHHSPKVIFRARVNQPVAPADPNYIVSLDYDTVTVGSYTDVWLGMTMLLGSAAGLDDYGRQRINTITSTYIGFCNTGPGNRDGELTIHDNDYITVIEEFRVWAKIPLITAGGGIIKDGTFDARIGAVNNVANPRPVSNTGPAMAGTINSGTGKLRVSFNGSQSIQQISISSGLSTVAAYAWNIGDGTLVTGTLTSSTIVVDFPAGFRYVHLTTTANNGTTHTAHCPVYARDPAADETLKHQVTNHRVTPQGQEISFRLLQAIPRDSYRDGALILFWEDEPADPTDRTHLRFVGWHQANQTQRQSGRTGLVETLTLDCLDVAGRLKQLPGFSQRVQSTVIDGSIPVAWATPNWWSETQYPTLWYYFWYLMYWHSTALEVADLITGSTTLNFMLFLDMGSDENNLFQQAEDFCLKVTPDHHLTCNRPGQLMLRYDPMILNYADRATFVGYADAFDETGWTEISFGELPMPRVNQIYTGAVLSTDHYPLDLGGNKYIPTLFCKAPSAARGQGLQSMQLTGRITAGQFDLNNCEGNRYARNNSPYGTVTVTVPWARLAATNDPAYLNWVQLDTLARSFNGTPAWLRPPYQAGVLRGIVREMTINYNYQRTGLVRMVTMTWEAETVGLPALTYTPEPTL
jgi:hypothetical protein